MITAMLLLSSIVVTVCGTMAWRLTGNRAICANTVFGAVALLFAAQQTRLHAQLDWPMMLTFFVTMVIGGRAIGTYIRSIRNEDYRQPAYFLIVASVFPLICTVMCFL